MLSSSLRFIASPKRSFILGGISHTTDALPGGLYLVSTPIGHLEDITLRALKTLASVDAILCEDQRVTLKLLSRYGIVSKLHTYNDHNAPSMRPLVLDALGEGRALALVSDAGTPLISDPGFKLVHAAQIAGFLIESLPGPSAVITALTLSGLPPNRFLFCGFFPHKKSLLEKTLQELARSESTVLFFETGPRIRSALEHLASALPERSLAVLRELTKRFQEVQRGTANEILSRWEDRAEILGEICLVVGPKDPEKEQTCSEEEIRQALQEAQKTQSFSRACAIVAQKFGLSKRDVYQKGLKDAQKKEHR